MRIYLDDCADDDDLIELLMHSGHEVKTPRSEGLRGAADLIHMDHAAEHDLVLLTRNPADFIALHEEYLAAGKAHAGILLVYSGRVRGKSITLSEVVGAIRHLESSGLPIANDVHNLNLWR